MRKGSHLGEFEELVLLAVASLSADAYGYAVRERLVHEAARRATLATVHSALYRLESKGLLKSELGGATAERGGRRKRLFHLTSAGRAAIQTQRKTRESLWNLIPDISPA